MRLALPRVQVPDGLAAIAPGVSAAMVLAFIANWITGGLGDPLARNPVLVAMLFGLALGNIFICPDILRPGLDFTKRYLLRVGIALIGFRITANLFINLGAWPLAIAAIELLTVLIIVRWLAKRVFKLDPEIAFLIAVGSAVCGAAAILSVAALTRAREQSAAIAIAMITLLGTFALLVYPVAFINGWFAGFDDHLYGVFVGASIYELAQVYGASFAVSEGALNAATLVKLSKVLMLIPLLFAIGLHRRFSSAASNTAPIHFPWFILAFVLIVFLNSIVTLHPRLRSTILNGDQFLFIMVMIALGITTRLDRLSEAGGVWRLTLLGLLVLGLSTLTAFMLVTPLTASRVPSTSEESLMLGDAGGRTFSSIGCAKCHVPSLPGRSGPITLYSDLLLHDMGPALDDKIAQGDATGADWRTTPLIGLHLRSRYLHDGRATTLHDAIFAHGGEAEIVRNRYLDLDEKDRQIILKFLQKL